MIVSFIPGRVRIRNAQLKNQENITALVSEISNLPFVESVEANIRTGSVLIKYEKSVSDGMGLEEILPFLGHVAPELAKYVNEEPQPAKKCRVHKKKFYYRALLGSLLLCMISPAFGWFRMHRYAGVVFGVLGVKHLIDYKKSII